MSKATELSSCLHQPTSMNKAYPIVVVFLLLCPWLIRANDRSSPAKTTHCKRTCGPKHRFQFPFGFSDGCEIRLNCSDTGEASLGGFPVQSVTGDSVRIHIQRQCDRPLTGAVDQLFGRNFALTSRNAILLENCTELGLPCEIPSILVQTRFSSLSCGSAANGTVSCYSEANTSTFVDPEKLRRRQCGFLLSSISADSGDGGAGPFSLAVEVAELGWWIEGPCQCDADADCVQLGVPGNHTGYRCRCKSGFEGDGFLAGLGCRRAFPKCNPARFLSGKCGGARVVSLLGVTAVIASLTVSLGLMTCCLYRRRAKQKARQLTKRRLSEATGNLSIPIYPYKDIEKATNSFSDKYRLGTGAYGTVYAAKLNSNDDWVAIKRLRHQGADSIEQVVNEIKLISSVAHPNLVRLLGCSLDYGDQILVYEFMPNGTLSQHLQRERGDGLPWLIRLNIATETAQAIAHLHSAIKPPIYHRDVKSSNILLDQNFRSKVADFGLSRLGIAETSHISTAPQGTPGYLDPQYHQNFHLSDKSDVYSFGVVLVEIITGLKAVDFLRPQNEVNLANLAADRISRGCLDEIIDPFLLPNQDAWTLSSIRRAAELAFRCLAFHRDMRPSMMEVAAELAQLRRSKSAEENSFSAPSEFFSSSSSSSASEKPLSSVNQQHNGNHSRLQTGSGSFGSQRAVLKENSPVSVQEAWLSHQSSPSSNGLRKNSALSN